MCAEAEARGEVSYIVCHSQEEAYRIHQKAQELGLFIGFPLTYAEFLNFEYAASTIKNFFIDNADKLLQYQTPVHIEAIVVEKTEVV
jgi:hypothetical protein